MIKILIVFIPFLLLAEKATAQTVGAGAEAIYNFQTESFGSGIRATVFPNKRISLSPQFSYFFPFNKIHEYTLGLAIEGKIVRIKAFQFYALAHGGYNKWLNYKSSALKGAKATNWNFEGGAGITTNTCLRPFLEYRYNIKFRETHLNLGFIYIFGCKNGKYFDNTQCPNF